MYQGYAEWTLREVHVKDDTLQGEGPLRLCDNFLAGCGQRDREIPYRATKAEVI